MKKLLLLCVSPFLLSSCATVFCGSRKSVVFESNIEKPATLTIDGQKHQNVQFPYVTKVRRGFNETIVKAEAEGYKPFTLTINKNFNAVSVVNLGFLIGWGIDAATGAMMKPEFNTYELEFFSQTSKQQE